MKILTLYKKKESPDYRTTKHSDSELILSHFLFGEHSFWGENTLEDVKRLAKMHGFEVRIIEE